MYSLERKANILNLLKLKGRVNVNELAESMSITPETVRKDLRELEQEGLLNRTHGGALPINTVITAPEQTENYNTVTGAEAPIQVRKSKTVSEKNLICQKAAAHIRNGDTIYVDNSSTTLYLPKYIPDYINVTIITNSIKFILEVASLNNPNLQVICLSGFLNINNLSLYGSRALKSAEEFFPNKAFVSCAGISPISKVTDTSLNEVDTKRTLMSKSEKVYLLADSTKIGCTAPYYLSDFNIIDYFITDSNISAEQLQSISQEQSIEVEVAAYK